MTTTNFSTPRDLLRYAVTRFNAAKLFFGHGSAEAFDEAAYLILHTLKLPLDRLDPFLDAKLLPEEVLQVLQVHWCRWSSVPDSTLRLLCSTRCTVAAPAECTARPYVLHHL